MAENYQVNYEDERFQKVEADKKTALAENEKTYDEMINQTDGFYQAQIDVSKQWADTQTKLQQENTDFAIEQIEQQKEQAQKDYTKEQAGAYADYKEQTDQYGVNAEKMAAQGMQNTGYSESSQVSMYNTYQNRVATARESFNRAVLNYDNAIKEAQLQNNSVLAEIAFTALEQQTKLALEGFQYKNELVLDKAATKREIDNTFDSRYQAVLSQINTENALAEEIRQANMANELNIKQLNETTRHNKANEKLESKSLAETKRHNKASEKQDQDELAETKRQFNKTNSGGSSSSKKSSSSGIKESSSNNTEELKIKGNDTGNIKSVESTGVNNAAKKAAKTNVVYSKYGSPEALDYLSALTKSGATKETVLAEIRSALKNGVITKTEAAALRNAFARTGNT